MKPSIFDINSLRVAAPCPVPWETMTGDDRVRRCNECELNIFNISEMTADEVEGLVQSRDGRMCIRLYRRADGTVLTKDCPVGLRALQKRLGRYAAAAFASVLGLFSISYAQSTNSDPTAERATKIDRTQAQKQECELVGTVLDPHGGMIPCVSITVYRNKEKTSLKTISDSKGNFSFNGLAEGTYRIYAKAGGFKKSLYEEVKVAKGEKVSLKMILDPGEASVTVGIYADVPLIDMTSTSVTTTITTRKIEKVPHR